MKHYTLSIFLAVVSMAAVAKADNTNYAPGDLVLYFQQEGGGQTVYASLGNAATLFRGAAAGPDAANSLNLLNVNAALVSAFGPGWADDPTVYAGLAGVWGTNNSASNNTLQDGDPHRTLYVSAARQEIGTVGQANTPGYVVNTNTGMTNGSSGIFQQNNVFDTTYETAVAVVPTGTSFIDEQNTFLTAGQLGAAFGIFESGVQQAGKVGSVGSFGDAGSVEFALDLYRILAKTTAPGQVAGTLREGSYEGTVTVNASGQVSFIAQGAAPVSSFATWIGGFNPPITVEADRQPAADPDFDGFSNLEEFVLNGNPAVSGQSIAPTLAVSATDFVFAFTRRDDSETEAPAFFQYGSDLVGWTDIALTASGTVGAATVAITEGDTVTDAVSVTLPKTVAPGGKLFGRIKIVK